MNTKPLTTKYIKARFIGGPFDGKALEVDDALDYIDVGAAGTLTTARYRRHLLTAPVGAENANAVFVPASLDAAEANRLITETLRPMR